MKPVSLSSRLRQRFKRKLQVWRLANDLISLVNSLDVGCMTKAQNYISNEHVSTDRVRAAQSDAVSRFLAEARDFARVRRQFEVGTGAQSATLQIVKAACEAEGYARISRAHAQVPLIAEAIAEPKSEAVVNMLEALPP